MGGTFSSLDALRSAIMMDLSSAMADVASNGLSKLSEETHEFYSAGNPKRYHRTGAYGNSPRCDGVSVGSNEVSTTFRLIAPHYYSDTGKSSDEIMDYIENDGPWIQGVTGRWQAFTEGDIPNIVESAFSRFL